MSRYALITREDFESWLTESFQNRWSRVDGRAGIYHIHLSDAVAVKMSTGIGRHDQGLERGKASMSMVLVSRIHGHVLNRKAKKQKHYQRTTNWRQTWHAGVQHWMGVYEKSPDFYDRIGREERGSQRREERGQVAYEPDEAFIDRLRLLWRASRGNDFARNFAESVGNWAKTRAPTSRQMDTADKLFRQYNIPTPSTVVGRHAAVRVARRFSVK